MLKINLSLCLTLFSFHTLALCPDLSIIDNTTPINLNNDISPKTVLRVDRGDTFSACRIKIGVDKGSSATYDRKLLSGVNSIDFNISKRNNMSRILKLEPDSQANQNVYTRRYRLKNANPFKKFKLFSELILSGNELPGNYSENYNIVVYQRGNGNTYNFFGQWPITYFYHIPTIINLSVVDSNQPFDEFDNSQDLSFGTIIQNDTKQFDIVVQSNNGYILKVSSQNNGSIKHEDGAVTIDYTFKVNSSPVNLSASSGTPVTIGTGSGAHTGDGFRLPIQVEMGDPTNKIAGYYEDQITISLTTSL